MNKFSIFSHVVHENINDVKNYTCNGDINVVNKNGASLLMEAIAYGKNDIADFLINSGIDINIQDKAGFSALHYAVWWKNLPIIKTLIKNGANVNQVDKKGNSPLWYSLTLYRNETDLDIVKELMIHGSNPYGMNIFGRSPMAFAQELNEEIILKVLSNNEVVLKKN